MPDTRRKPLWHCLDLLQATIILDKQFFFFFFCSGRIFWGWAACINRHVKHLVFACQQRNLPSETSCDIGHSQQHSDVSDYYKGICHGLYKCGPLSLLPTSGISNCVVCQIKERYTYTIYTDAYRSNRICKRIGGRSVTKHLKTRMFSSRV